MIKCLNKKGYVSKPLVTGIGIGVATFVVGIGSMTYFARESNDEIVGGVITEESAKTSASSGMTYNQLEEAMRQAAERRKSADGKNGLSAQDGTKTSRVGDSGSSSKAASDTQIPAGGDYSELGGGLEKMDARGAGVRGVDNEVAIRNAVDASKGAGAASTAKNSLQSSSSGNSFGSGASSSVSATLPTYNPNSSASAGAARAGAAAERAASDGGGRFSRGRAGSTGGSGVQGARGSGSGSGQYGAGAMSDLARAARMSKTAAQAGSAAQKIEAAREAFGEGGGEAGPAIDPNANAANSLDKFTPSVNKPNLSNTFSSDDSKKEDLEEAKDKQLTAMVHKARTAWAFKAIFAANIVVLVLALAPIAPLTCVAMLGALSVLLIPDVPMEWKIAAAVTLLACLSLLSLRAFMLAGIPYFGWAIIATAAILSVCVGLLLSMNAMALNDWSKQTFDLDHEGSVAQKLKEVNELSHYSTSFEEIEKVKFTFYREALYILGKIDGVSWKDILGEGSIKAKEINDEMDTRYKYPEAYKTYGTDPDGTTKTWIEYIREHESKIIDAVSKESPKFRKVWPDFCEYFDLNEDTGRPNDGRYEPVTADNTDQTNNGNNETPPDTAEVS